jgi:hypothetical protein
LVEPAQITATRTQPNTTPTYAEPITTPDERTPQKATLTTSPASRDPDQTPKAPASPGPSLTPIGVPATGAEKALGLRAALADIRQQMSGRSQIGTVAAASSPMVRLESLEPPLRELEPRK